MVTTPLRYAAFGKFDPTFVEVQDVDRTKTPSVQGRSFNNEWTAVGVAPGDFQKTGLRSPTTIVFNGKPVQNLTALIDTGAD
ncbi:hypothetical protein BJF92_00740 [Rhizobium rhizosphaerae]|uniref:Peptidase A2 domain-containing protein n=1 Tax=Xaviernesmea rhizosphaerae TaxID=1672749 RepID=A0A1Q9AEE3_9HYPH|nr:hypothetical protein [Agrobacterium sp. FDAARGOS_525]OLP53328.1 hypothetical protein BJF92_00740 [Xaviernesmea rhizosphaerae]RSC37277.1 hypothetical protein EGT36_08395 [Agrobacterium sp. FDAARGOS_525]